jgi:hypothetical protein
LIVLAALAEVSVGACFLLFGWTVFTILELLSGWGTIIATIVWLVRRTSP